MSDDHHAHDASHGAAYRNVFIALCVFTLVSVGADWFKSDTTRGKIILGAVVLAVATCKALCVMLYFMHLKFERAWKYLLLAPTLIIAAALPLSLRPDIGETYYTLDIQQQRDYPEHEASQNHGGGHH
jgi:cytochrome c oxidase subunit 4